MSNDFTLKVQENADLLSAYPLRDVAEEARRLGIRHASGLNKAALVQLVARRWAETDAKRPILFGAWN